MNLLGFIVDDWREIPQNIRYYILSGVGLLAIVWVANDVGIHNSFHDFLFNLGVFLILFGVLILLIKQIWLPLKLIYYRIKYPLKNLNKTFSLIRFNERIILFDKRDKDNKRSYHVHPLKTARDLSFNTHALPIQDDFDRARLGNSIIGNRGDTIYIKVNDYQYRGLINTRR